MQAMLQGDGMIPILFTLPRSGSNLCASILGITAGDSGFVGNPSVAKAYHVVLNKARKHNGLWTHYPFTNKMVNMLKNSQEFEVYVNLRDPRDIIISYAWAVETKPQWWWNYKCDGKSMLDYVFHDRIDCLIDKMHTELFRHDKWRKSGICKPMYYSENVKHPLAKVRTEIKRRGIVGSHKDRMTDKQIERCNQVYGELIEVWK
jgi:hypothetical protein